MFAYVTWLLRSGFCIYADCRVSQNQFLIIEPQTEKRRFSQVQVFLFRFGLSYGNEYIFDLQNVDILHYKCLFIEWAADDIKKNGGNANRECVGVNWLR